MSTWDISVFESGSTYSSDGTIPRPHADIETQKVSNLQVIKLSDGSEGYIQPETKYSKGTITMFFADTTSAFRTQLDNYINNGDKVKITTHTAEIFYGYFMDYKRIWLVGTEDTFDINVVFKESLS